MKIGNIPPAPPPSSGDIPSPKLTEQQRNDLEAMKTTGDEIFKAAQANDWGKVKDLQTTLFNQNTAFIKANPDLADNFSVWSAARAYEVVSALDVNKDTPAGQLVQNHLDFIKTMNNLING